MYLFFARFRYFRNYSRIVLEFLPQVIFLVFLFMWMVVMMFIKWIIYGPVAGIFHFFPSKWFNNLSSYSCFPEPKFRPNCAPSVLIYFINMLLFKKGEPNEGCDEFMFDFQPTLQKILVFTSLLCIPVMLLGTPIYVMCTRKSHKPKVQHNHVLHLSV